MALNFYETLSAAIKDLTANGFDSIVRVEYWTKQLRDAAASSLTPEHELAAVLSANYRQLYTKLIEKGDILKQHKGIARFTLDRVRPALRVELDRRTMASANLIKLNRQKAIENTLQRFSGWSTSIPAGGTDVAGERREASKGIRKPLAQLPFEERRVLIDQGHKFVANLNQILAVDGGAIAGRWFSHFRQPGYDYREDHKERDGKVYLLRNSWAKDKGYVKPSDAGYYDQVTAVGVEPMCRCAMVWYYSPADLPVDMQTQKWRDEVARQKALRT